MLGFLAVVLASVGACAAPTVASGASATNTSPAGATGAAVPVDPGAQPSLDPATADAKARIEAALDRAVAGGGKPATERIRAEVTGAGFLTDQVAVTASRTPTGLDSDAVEAAVKVGKDCIVAQLRTGSVAVTVLPALADGGCLVAVPA